VKCDWITRGGGADTAMGGRRWRDTRDIRFCINFLLLAKGFLFSAKYNHITDGMFASIGSFLRKKIMKNVIHENWKKKYQFDIIC